MVDCTHDAVKSDGPIPYWVKSSAAFRPSKFEMSWESGAGSSMFLDCLCSTCMWELRIWLYLYLFCSAWVPFLETEMIFCGKKPSLHSYQVLFFCQRAVTQMLLRLVLDLFVLGRGQKGVLLLSTCCVHIFLSCSFSSVGRFRLPVPTKVVVDRKPLFFLSLGGVN